MGGMTRAGQKQTYLTIKADGRLHQKSAEGEDGAELHKSENPQSGETWESWDIIYKDIIGYITKIWFADGKYGRQLNLEVNWGDGKAIVQMGVKSSYGSAVLKKLPNADLSRELKIAPYPKFTTKEGEEIGAGVTLAQEAPNGDWVKLDGFFWDPESKTQSLHGYPTDAPPKNPKTGKALDKDLKDAYDIKVRKFLQGYLEQNVIPNVKVMSGNKASGPSPADSSGGGEYDQGDGGDEGYQDDDIPF